MAKAIHNFTLHSQRSTQQERPKKMPENDKCFLPYHLDSDVPWLLNAIPFPRALLLTLDKVSVRSWNPWKEMLQSTSAQVISNRKGQ